MTPGDIDELGIAARGPDRETVAYGPEREAREPESQAKAQSAGERAVDDGQAARGAAQQYGLGQCPMDRRQEPRHLLFPALHQTSAPPPKEKNDRKKLLAAKAIDRPKTIWISLRKPPEVSPKASARPVAMMTMTAMILATGPSID